MFQAGSEDLAGDLKSQGKRFDVTVAGELNLDLILYGLAREMPVERELLASNFALTLGSSSAILAHNLATLGSRVGFCSMVGDDPLGAIALKRLAESGVDLSETRYTSRSTGVTLLLPHGDVRHILTYPGTMAELRIEDLDLGYLTSARHFHLSSLYLQKGMHAGLPALFGSLKAAGLSISLDTNDDPEDLWGAPLEELLEHVDVLLPNESELLRMTRKADVAAALDAMRTRVRLLVVKCGARGAIVQQGEHREMVAPVPVVPVDTIGAGDSFDAGFLHAWLGGADPVRAAAMGNLTGALSTQGAGGTEAFRDRGLMREFLAHR